MGRVFKFHNDVDTDQIIASQYLLLPNIEEMKVYNNISRPFGLSILSYGVNSMSRGEKKNCRKIGSF